jgi:hypothetical protein
VPKDISVSITLQLTVSRSGYLGVESLLALMMIATV